MRCTYMAPGYIYMQDSPHRISTIKMSLGGLPAISHSLGDPTIYANPWGPWGARVADRCRDRKIETGGIEGLEGYTGG